MAASIFLILKVEHAWKFLYQDSNFYKWLDLWSLSDIAQVYCLHCGQADHPSPHPSTPQPPSLTSVSQHQEPGYDRFSIVCLKVFPNSSSSSTEYFQITLDSCRETLLRPPFTCLMTCKFSFFFFFLLKVTLEGSVFSIPFIVSPSRILSFI